MIAAERPDLVDIATPPPTHKSLIERAAAAGANIICQKPFTTSLDEARAATEVAEAAGVSLFVHENFRFQPWYRKIKQLLDDGTTGPLYEACFRLRPGDGQGPDAYLDRQPYFQTMPRFLIHETGIHFIDVFRFLLGEVRWVWADLQRRNPAISGEDAGIVVFGFDEGLRALFDGNRLADHAAVNRRLTMGELTLEGETGCLMLDGDGKLHHRRQGDHSATPVPFDWQDRGFGGDCVMALQRHAVAHLLDNSAAENLARDYIRNLEIEEAIYRSAEEGRRLTL